MTNFLYEVLSIGVDLTIGEACKPPVGQSHAIQILSRVLIIQRAIEHRTFLILETDYKSDSIMIDQFLLGVSRLDFTLLQTANLVALFGNAVVYFYNAHGLIRNGVAWLACRFAKGKNGKLRRNEHKSC